MKIRSIKVLALCFSLLTMTHSAGMAIQPDHAKHHHCRKHHRLPQCKIPIPGTDSIDLALRISTDLHTQNRGLDILVTAEAFAPHPIPVIIDITTSPATITVTDPHIAELIQAVNSTTKSGRDDLITVLNAFGINGAPFANSLLAFLLAGEQYSIAIANSIPSAPYLYAWVLAGIEMGNQLSLVLDFTPGSAESNQLQGLIQDVVNDEANGILGLNQLLPPNALLPGETQSDAALRYFILGRIATTTIGKITVDQLVLNFNERSCILQNNLTSN